MRSLSRIARVVPFAAAALVAGCGGGGGTESNPRLTAAQVAGVYKLCTLSFRPIQTALPQAELLISVIDPAPPAPKTAPSLTLSGTTNAYQLIYTRSTDSFTQSLTGNVSLGSDAIILTFPGEENEIRRELLLPGQLLLHFGDGPRHLAAVGETSYAVRRADYARAAEISEEGLQERINGTVTGTFTTGTCP